MGIMNTFPGAEDTLNKYLEEQSSSDFGKTVAPLLNASSQPTFYRYTTQDGVTLITSESSYKGMWAWDAARGLRQIATEDSEIYGSLSGGDVDGGAIFAVDDASYSSIYYYESPTDSVTLIAPNRTRTTRIDGITPTYDGNDYWVILSYSYYSSSGTNVYGSTLEYLNWPDKTFTSKYPWDTSSRNKILTAVTGGCLFQRQQSRGDSDACLGVYISDSNTYKSSNHRTSEGNWSLVRVENGIYYMTCYSSVYSLYIYDSASYTWGSTISRGVGSGPEVLVELPGKTVYMSGDLCVVDWQNSTSTLIWTGKGNDTGLSSYKIDSDNYLLWTSQSSYKGIWHYTVSAGTVEEIDSTLYSLAEPMPWGNGLLFTKGALAYYDIMVRTLTVLDEKCEKTANVNKHVIATVSDDGYIKLYDLDNNLALLQTSPKISSYLYALAVYGDTILVADHGRRVYVYSINENTVYFLDSCESNVSGYTSYGKDGKLFVPYMYVSGTDWYMYDARTMTKVKVDWQTVYNSI